MRLTKRLMAWKLMEEGFKLIMKGEGPPKNGFLKGIFYAIFIKSNYRFGGGKGKTRGNKDLDTILEEEYKKIRAQ